MWPFTRRTRVSEVSDEALAALAKQLHAVGLKQADLVERLEALEAAHERLRGRFYALGGGRAPREPQTKAEILREFGYQPGKPTPHQ